jgi:hypothetical protein
MDDCGLDRGSRCGGRSLLSAALLGGRRLGDSPSSTSEAPSNLRALCCWCLDGVVSLAFRFTCAICIYVNAAMVMSRVPCHHLTITTTLNH